MRPYSALIVAPTAQRAGKLVFLVGQILARTYAAATNKLKITIQAQVICPICEKVTPLKKESSHG